MNMTSTPVIRARPARQIYDYPPFLNRKVDDLYNRVAKQISSICQLISKLTDAKAQEGGIIV